MYGERMAFVWAVGGCLLELRFIWSDCVNDGYTVFSHVSLTKIN